MNDHFWKKKLALLKFYLISVTYQVKYNILHIDYSIKQLTLKVKHVHRILAAECSDK